jgi:hypothetical protein
MRAQFVVPAKRQHGISIKVKAGSDRRPPVLHATPPTKPGDLFFTWFAMTLPGLPRNSLKTGMGRLGSGGTQIFLFC